VGGLSRFRGNAPFISSDTALRDSQVPLRRQRTLSLMASRHSCRTMRPGCGGFFIVAHFGCIHGTHNRDGFDDDLRLGQGYSQVSFR